MEELRLDVEGYDSVTDAIMNLLNTYPGLDTGETIIFSVLPEGSGISMFTSTGASIYSESESITGHVTQMCQYPFTLVYRASGLSRSKKVDVKDWLDTLGRWLERQTVKISGTEYVMNDYPTLQGNRKFKTISRQTPSYLSQIYEDKSEDWIMEMVAKYRNEFDT